MRLRTMSSLVAISAAALFLPTAALGGPGDDGIPRGMLAFFAGDVAGCPAGWQPADYAAGRLVVGVTDASGVGVTVGTPLADQEDRAHAHPYSGSVTLASLSIAGADGSNNQGAQSGTTRWTDVTASAPSGL